MNDTDFECGGLADYVEFMGMPKKGEVLRYLLAAQVRKRILEEPPFNWRRLVKGAALTGNPEKLIEIYYLDPRTLRTSLEKLTHNPKPFFQQEIENNLVNDPTADLARHCYTRVGFREEPPRGELAMKRYLLHLTLALQSEEKIPEFTQLMESLLKIFAQHGLSLMSRDSNW